MTNCCGVRQNSTWVSDELEVTLNACQNTRPFHSYQLNRNARQHSITEIRSDAIRSFDAHDLNGFFTISRIRKIESYTVDEVPATDVWLPCPLLGDTHLVHKASWNPNRIPSITSSGTSPQANLETTWTNNSECGSLSKTGNTNGQLSYLMGQVLHRDALSSNKAETLLHPTGTIPEVRCASTLRTTPAAALGVIVLGSSFLSTWPTFQG